jgi:hypothetical protein
MELQARMSRRRLLATAPDCYLGGLDWVNCAVTAQGCTQARQQQPRVYTLVLSACFSCEVLSTVCVKALKPKSKGVFWPMVLSCVTSDLC